MVTFSSLFKKQQEPGRIGLALSGGGSKGFAHIGVLKAMEEKDIVPDIIAGTSAGSLAGVLYADGYCPEEIVDLFNKKSFKQFAELIIPQGGLFKLDRLQVFLKKTLRSKKFEDLQIPLRVVATDLERGKSVVFDKGKIIEPILASCAYPIVFKPIQIGTKYYIDGGLLKNFPVSTIRKDCECVIGVNVNPLSPEDYKDSLLYVAERTFHYVTIANTIPDRKLCDILIELNKLTEFKMFSLDNVKKIYEIGYQYAIDNLSKEEHVEMLKKTRQKK